MKQLKCKSGEFEIDLALRSRCTIICGDSASGKTSLFETLKNVKSLQNVYLINYDSVKNIENYNVVADYIKRSSGKFIVIDQADDIQSMNDDIMYAINMDDKNTFIIIGREPALIYNYLDVAELEIKNNKFTLNYFVSLIHFVSPFSNNNISKKETEVSLNVSLL